MDRNRFEWKNRKTRAVSASDAPYVRYKTDEFGFSFILHENKQLCAVDCCTLDDNGRAMTLVTATRTNEPSGLCELFGGNHLGLMIS